MFEAGLECGNALAMIYTFRPAAGSMAAEFDALVAERGVSATLTGIYCDNALTAKRSGDPDLHDRLIADCAGEQPEFDAILLAQFSMASAAPLLRRQSSVPILTAPESALLQLRRKIQSVSSADKPV